MPEIKHNFTGGKMNKDLDERIIPNGQYRDAMNIQVSTSEDSDVGTVQNILGNSIAPGQEFIGDDSTCVGSISDEKNDKLYWFVLSNNNEEHVTNGEFTGNADDWTHGGNPLDGTGGWNYGTDNVTATDVLQWDALKQETFIGIGRTYIVSVEISNYSGTGDLSPVLVDENGGWTRPQQIYAATGNNNGEPWVWVIRIGEEFGDASDYTTSYSQSTKTPYTATPNFIYFQNRMNTSGGSNKLNCTIDNISVKSVDSSRIIQYDTKKNTVTPVFVDNNNSVLKFDPNNLITGINIIDDLLFWTDNNSEPKKINIPRSIQGTYSQGYQNTYIINNAQNIDIEDKISVKEEHITVIRKPPKHPPTIKYTSFRDITKDYTGVVKISDSINHPNSFINSSIGRIHDFNFLNVGDTFSTIIETDINGNNVFALDWQPGDKVVLKEFDFGGIPPAIPITDYRIKGTITDWQGNSFTNTNWLLTNNGDISEGTGTMPTSWHQNSGNNWIWDQELGTLTCDGTNGNIDQKTWNENTLRDIKFGGHYKIKYTISDPTGHGITGEVWPKIFGSETTDPSGGSNAAGYYWQLGKHGSAGRHEHEIVFDHIDQGVGTVYPRGRGAWQWSNTYLNAIVFESKGTGISLGLNEINIKDFSNFTAGAPANPNGGPGISIINNVITWAAWDIVSERRVKFLREKVTGDPGQVVYLSNIQDDYYGDLIDKQDYQIVLTISNMVFTGVSANQAIGVTSGAGVGNTVRIKQGSGTGITATEAVPGDPWAGLGGRVTYIFTADATSSGQVDLFAQAVSGHGVVGDSSPGNYAPNGPSGDIKLSVKKAVEPGFNGSISDVSVEEIDKTVARTEIKIDSIDGIPPNVLDGDISLNYAIDLLEEDEKLFEFKFPRFAYRYKYEDGEYSAISPFSEVAFVPGGFDYHPKKSYNLGMINNIKSLTIKDYSRDIPQDVSGIDILYKEERSPNIYIVDNIKNVDQPWSSYTIKQETIKNGVLPSNQLLRPWDNVPKKALGQEIVGNRIIYGNYLQNYDLTDSITNKDYDINIKPQLVPVENISRTGKKSIKSLREYQVGVVFSDEYGRETPIITNNTATTLINKSNSAGINKLTVSVLNEGHPVNMKYFKFFIKDTGGEYYNLAMDRYYDAEDDNIWLAFPSTDINKVNIDDFLILKKGVGAVIKDPKTGKLENVIQEKAQYKIIDIKNEAPDFIKRKETLIASKKHYITANKLFDDLDLPAEGDINFSIEYDQISSSSYANLHEDFNKDSDVEYHISLSNTTTNRVSNRYKVIQLHNDDTNDKWRFTLEKPFTNEINSFTNDPSGVNVTVIIANTYLNIYRTAIDKSALYKFDGRFFVKIYNDDIFARALKDKVSNVKKEYKSTGISRKIYSLKAHDNSNRIEKHYDNTNNTTLAFFDIQSKTGKVGLNNNISNKKNDSRHSWFNYYAVTSEFTQNLGTLNNAKRLSAIHHNTAHDPLRDPDVWRDYDAYFRGINVYLGDNAIKDRVDKLDIHDDDVDNQNFEDVWFIDKAVNVANFHHSTISGDDVGWDTWPTRTSWNSMGLRSWSGGEEGSSDIELSFGGIQPVKWSTDTDGWDRDLSFYDLAGENYNYSEREADFIKQIAIGSQFRFKEDKRETIYTVIAVDIFLRVRYESLRNGYFGGYYDGNKDPAEGMAIDPNQIFPFHAKARQGKASGLYDASRGLSSNVMGDTVIDKTGLETELEAEDNSIVFATCSYLRPSNYTKNWRIRVDKAFNDYWNPVENVGAISNTSFIELTVNTSGGANTNYVKVDSITGGGTNKDILSVGMVLKKYDNNGAGTFTDMSPPAIVSKISDNGSDYTIYFKTYDGSSGWVGTGSGTPSDLNHNGTNGDKLRFYQYSMNGLSPNSAKNLNFFRDGMGFDDTNSGTDAVGYTWEWVEEKSNRSEEEILPANPAVWETKPKENADLDIYYEATGAIPIYTELTKENILELIPINSIVEHEGSNSIPKGTKVIQINPETEEIVLSKNIQVEEAPASEVYLAWLQSFGFTQGAVPPNTVPSKIICTELCEQGYLPKEILDLDHQHSNKHVDIAAKIGYWKWAGYVVDAMKKSKIITHLVKPIGMAWAYEMAHREEPENYRSNLLGKLVIAIGVPICRYIGKKEIIKNNIHV